MQPQVVCIGGATIDRKLRLAGRFVPGSSNPVSTTTAHGGVARNVCETLARLAVPTALVTAIGRDAVGAAILDHLAALGVDTAGCLRVDTAPTAEYVAVLDADGGLVAGFAAMDVLATIDVALVGGAAGRLAGAAWVFADANLPGATLAEVARRAGAHGCRLAVDAVSVAKSARLAAVPTPDLLFLNRDEAAAVLGLSADAGAVERAEPRTTSAAAMAAALRRRGAAAVVLTLGAEGAIVADAAGERRVPAASSDVVDVTGAGDALVAGTLAGLVAGLSLDAAVARGSRVAARTIESEATVRVDIATAAR